MKKILMILACIGFVIATVFTLHMNKIEVGASEYMTNKYDETFEVAKSVYHLDGIHEIRFKNNFKAFYRNNKYYDYYEEDKKCLAMKDALQALDIGYDFEVLLMDDYYVVINYTDVIKEEDLKDYASAISQKLFDYSHDIAGISFKQYEKREMFFSVDRQDLKSTGLEDIKDHIKNINIWL